METQDVINPLEMSTEIRIPEHPGTPDTVRAGTKSRLSLFFLLAALATTQGCATGPRCRHELITNDEQAKHLTAEGCKRTGKLEFKCCDEQAKDYNPFDEK